MTVHAVITDRLIDDVSGLEKHKVVQLFSGILCVKLILLGILKPKIGFTPGEAGVNKVYVRRIP